MDPASVPKLVDRQEVHTLETAVLARLARDADPTWRNRDRRDKDKRSALLIRQGEFPKASRESVSPA